MLSPTTQASDSAPASNDGRDEEEDSAEYVASASIASPSTSASIVSVDHPQIRHAGRASVRGKIRRVWRPRYLELWDNALVRYYELPSSAEIGLHADRDWDRLHVNMIPKYTLAVYSRARILDGTTLRDMHVGLPQATFGFVFRGQRLTHFERGHQQAEISSVSLMNPMNVQCGMPKEPPQEQVRDFYCAVSSLEEAQTWVVALQWAASQTTSSGDAQTPRNIPSEPWWRQEGGEDSDDDDNFDDPDLVFVGSGVGGMSGSLLSSVGSSDYLAPAKKAPPASPDASSLPQHPAEPHGDTPATTTAVAAAAPTTLAQPQGKPSNQHHHRRGGGYGKVVVSKVVRYRLVRVRGLQFEIGYEIHGMLLRQRVSEQWSMLRTADDLQALVGELCKELGPSLLDRAQVGVIRRLPRFKDKPPPGKVEKSLSIVDSILRSLVMDAAMVNTSAMKAFLGLSVASAATVASAAAPKPPVTTALWPPLASRQQQWWHVHDHKSILDRKAESLPELITTDQYVKSWLQQSARNNKNKRSNWPSSLDACALSVWQRPLVYVCGVGVSAAALVPLSHLWQQVVPRISVRMDTLLISWVSAAYLGGLYQENCQLTPAAAPATSRQRRVKPSVPPEGVPTVLKPSPPSVAHAAQSRVAGDKEAQDATVSVDVSVTQEEEEDEEASAGSLIEEESDGEEMAAQDEQKHHALSSPLPEYPDNNGVSVWSKPKDSIFHVRGVNYLRDRIKIPSDAAPLTCRGVDVWITDEPMRNISRHPDVLGGKLGEEDTFLVNFLLPFGNFVAYFSVPPLNKFTKKLRNVWTKFLKGDQQYRDARLKLLPVVVDGPWIVRTACGSGKSPALLGKVIPLQYFFRDPDRTRKGVYEVDVIITASTLAKGILSVVKSHTTSVSIAFALIIEAAEQDELPESVLCSFQIHKLNLVDCPILPDLSVDDNTESSSS